MNEAVEIARDALKQIENSTFYPHMGQFFSGPAAREVDKFRNFESSQTVLKEILFSRGYYCKVCAKGALLISHVLRNNKMSCEELSDTDSTNVCIPSIPSYLLDEMEILFEGRSYAWNMDRGVRADRAIELIAVSETLSEDDEERLKEILKMFIDRDGQSVID